MRELQIRQILGEICADIDARQARAAAAGVAIAAAVAFGQGCSSTVSSTPAYAAPIDAGTDTTGDATNDAATDPVSDLLPLGDAALDSDAPNDAHDSGPAPVYMAALDPGRDGGAY